KPLFRRRAKGAYIVGAEPWNREVAPVLWIVREAVFVKPGFERVQFIGDGLRGRKIVRIAELKISAFAVSLAVFDKVRRKREELARFGIEVGVGVVDFVFGEHAHEFFGGDGELPCSHPWAPLMLSLMGRARDECG